MVEDIKMSRVLGAIKNFILQARGMVLPKKIELQRVELLQPNQQKKYHFHYRKVQLM